MVRRLLRASTSAVWPITRGTSVLVPSAPTYCLTSIAITSAGFICPFRDSTTRRSSRGISSDTNTTRTLPPQVLPDARPEVLDVGLLAKKLRDDQVRVVVIMLTLAREQLAELLERPVHHAVGGVVEHLPDDLPSDPAVGAALDLDERPHGVLVEEQVVDRPAAGRVLVVGKRGLPANQQSAARDAPEYWSPASRLGNLAISFFSAS